MTSTISPDDDLLGAVRILVIDDDPLNQRVFGTVLRKAGFDVASAYGGTEALTLCAGAAPDLVLLDYQMPEMNGVEVLRRLRALGRMKDVPILMLTAANGDEHIEQSLGAGADDYIVKPVDPRILRARVTSVVRSRRDLRRAGQAAALTADLDEARKVQLAQLPRVPVRLPGWRATGAVVASGAVGGDVFDLVEGRDGIRIAVLVDVSGHGTGAALVAAGIRAELRTLLRTHPIAEAFELLNGRLLDDGAERYACVAAVALGSDRIRVVNAGLPPVCVGRDGSIHASVEANGVPPGLLSDQSYEERTIAVRPGDRIVLMSDGLMDVFGTGAHDVWERLGLFDPRQWCEGDPISADERVKRWTADHVETFCDDASVLLLEATAA